MAERYTASDLANRDATTLSGKPTNHEGCASAADTDSSSVSDQDSNQPTKSSQKTKRSAAKSKTEGIFSTKSFRTNWRWYFIGVLIFLAILLPIVLKVVLPAVVQLIVNQQDLPILGGSFLFQGTDSMLINLNSSFQSPLPAAVDSFPLQLYNKGAGNEFSPWLKLQVPPLRINQDTKFQIDEQVQQIVNGEEFTKWFGKLVDEENVTVDVRGNGTTIKLGLLDSRPVLDKGIVMKALNLRHGIVLRHLQLVLPAVNGRNLKGKLMIPNKSPIAFGIGDYTFDLFAGGINFGYITIRNTILRPGENLQELDGYADLATLAESLYPILQSQFQALAEGELEVNVTGRECSINGQKLTYIENVLNHRDLIIRGPAISLLGDLVGGLLTPQANSDDNSYLGSTVVDSVSTVFGNKTLMRNIANHWNKTTETRQKRTLPGTDQLSRLLEKYII